MEGNGEREGERERGITEWKCVGREGYQVYGTMVMRDGIREGGMAGSEGKGGRGAV